MTDGLALTVAVTLVALVYVCGCALWRRANRLEQTLVEQRRHMWQSPVIRRREEQP